MSKLVEEKVFDMGYVQDANGNVVHDALQLDDPIVRRKYDDGTIVLRSQRTGKLLGLPYRMNHVGEFRPVENWEEPDAVQEQGPASVYVREASKDREALVGSYPQGPKASGPSSSETMMATTLCSCCKREITADTPQGVCWECRGRPAVTGWVEGIPGERDPKCPHAFPTMPK